MTTELTDPFADLADAVPSLLLTRVPLTHPTFANITDYNDAAALHDAVMRLFPDNLPGTVDRRRTTNAILYRLQDTTGIPHMLVQSLIAPLPDLTLRTIDLTSWVTTLQDGTPVTIQLRYNTVTSGYRDATTRNNPRKRIQRLTDHLGTRFPWLTDLAITNTVERPGLHLNTTPIYATDITLTGVIANHLAAVTDLIHGVGKAKAYGCGMLLITPN